MISLIISSYNRADHLIHSLQSILKIESKTPFEILFVDNNSTDNTKEVIDNLLLIYNNIDFKYLLEKSQGVSFARNRGIEESKFSRVVLLDDDIIVEKNFVDNLAAEFNTNQFACFSGCIYSHFLHSKPRWMSELYESNCIYGINEHSEIWGAFIAIDKTIIQERFDTQIGPKASKFSYGEDTLFIHSLKAKGLKVGVVDGLGVGHIVQKEKYSLRWNLKNQIRRGKANVAIIGAEKNNWSLMSEIIIHLTKNLIKAPYTLLQNQFSFKNLVYQILDKPLMNYGKLITKSK